MHVMVTGAARGIGAAVVELCVQQGFRVTAADIDAEAVRQRFKDSDAVHASKLDVRDADQWQAAADLAWQRVPVDVLVNVAGVLRAGVTGELVAVDVSLQLDVNVLGVINGTNALASLMTGRGEGHIINIGSTACLFATPGNGVYAASKHAVRGFTLAAAGDLRPRGVDVSLVCPTAVKTDMLEQQRGDPRAAMTFEGKRALAPNEVAAAIVQDVMRERPLERYLPAGDGWRGKLCTVLPELLLRGAEKSRRKGIENFDSTRH